MHMTQMKRFPFAHLCAVDMFSIGNCCAVKFFFSAAIMRTATIGNSNVSSRMKLKRNVLYIAPTFHAIAVTAHSTTQWNRMMISQTCEIVF